MSVYDKYKPSSSNALYLKVSDGDKIKLRIYSQPAISIYKTGDKPRFSWVVFVHDINGKEVNAPSTLTKGISVYSQIAALKEDWGEPTEFDIRLSRTGAGLNDTEYSVVPIKNSVALTKEQEAEADKIDLLQAVKGKWLEDYADDGILPDPVVTVEVPTKSIEGEPVDIEDVPDDFLT